MGAGSRRDDHCWSFVGRPAFVSPSIWQLGIASVAGLASLGAAAAAYARLVEPTLLDIQTIDIPIRGLPASFDGYTIAHLSDFHLARRGASRRLLAHAVAACNKLAPDCVALTGDYLNERRAARFLFGRLEKLAVRPVFAVLGNHDYRYGPNHRRALLAGFNQLGVTVLDNRNTSVARGADRIWFVGVGDGYSSHDWIERALQDLGPDDHPRILLSHYPDLLLDLPRGTVDLSLSGHTHGGQINIPIVLQMALAHSDTAYASGAFEVGGTALYVNRGLGTSNAPVRLRAKPELTLIHLRARDRDAP